MVTAKDMGMKKEERDVSQVSKIVVDHGKLGKAATFGNPKKYHHLRNSKNAGTGYETAYLMSTC